MYLAWPDRFFIEGRDSNFLFETANVDPMYPTKIVINDV